MPQEPVNYSKLASQETNGGTTSPKAYCRPNGDSAQKAGDPIILPPGTDSQTFKDFTLRLAEVVGSENVTVITKAEELNKDSYLDPSKIHDMYHVLDRDYFISSAVVAPRKVSEVQAIMRLCNEFEIPVWPFSIGRNVGMRASSFTARSTS